MRFIADGMLGKLTRWLRMLGQDVEYSNQLDDSELIAKAKEEQRVLLTRDLELYQRATAKDVDAFYVEGKTEAEKLAELANRFDIPLYIDLKLSRCPKCNTQIRTVPKEELAGRVEEKTFRYYSEFWECPRCGSVYWQGAHWGRIRATLKEAEENLKKTRAA
ncbi:MAG: Mut7-C RNAse domain-containing protein [Candidatus Bathyarchaeota archaeon]|nr:Mut7-C RNAse domain-containing protein [Candidatus Bathyarchaeota archaeon]